MGTSILGLASLVLCSAVCWSTAYAEAKKSGSSGEILRYFEFSDNLLEDLPGDAVLREVRQRGNVVSATLDVCHSISQTSLRKDRFVVPLKWEGGKLVGTGQSQEERVPITVSLVRKQTGKTVSFEGSIIRGSIKTNFLSKDNTDESEAEFRENQTSEMSIVPLPTDFTKVSPDALAVRVKRDSFLEVVKRVRSEDVKVLVDRLTPDCRTLRSGQQVLRFSVDPERAPTLVEKLQTYAGIVAAGWTEEGGYDSQDAIRFPAASWLDAKGKLDREKLASAITASAAKTFRGRLDASTWDMTTGELTIKLKVPNESVSELNLIDIIEVTLLVGPEKLNSRQNLILFFRDPEIDTVDEGPEPRFKLFSDDNSLRNMDLRNGFKAALSGALARDFNGQIWDDDKSTWK
jgi:hypothetical protein